MSQRGELWGLLQMNYVSFSVAKIHLRHINLKSVNL
jgi:hypothetical protein